MKRTIIFILVLLLSAVSTASAESVCTAKYEPIPDTIWSTLKKKNNKDCYKGEVDKYKQAFGIATGAKDISEIREKTIQSWKYLRDRAQTEVSNSNVAISNIFNSVSKRASTAADMVSASAPPEIIKGAPGPSAWKIIWTPGILPTISKNTKNEIKLKDDINLACKQEVAGLESGEAKQCLLVYEASEKLITIILVGNSVGRYYGKELINDLASDIHNIDKEWDTFIFESKPMYPLDLLTTDAFYRWFSDYDKSTEGFRRPPKYQWFFMHPSPAFEYVSSAVDGEQLKPSIYLEILGVNAWKNKYFTGASIIATYTDRNDVADTGYGLLFTYNNNYSIAITRHGSETGVLFSLDLANFYNESLKPTINSIR